MSLVKENCSLIFCKHCLISIIYLFQVFGNAWNECLATSRPFYAGRQRPKQCSWPLQPSHRPHQWAKETLHALHGPHDARGPGGPQRHLRVPVPIQAQQVELLYGGGLDCLWSHPFYSFEGKLKNNYTK